MQLAYKLIYNRYVNFFIRNINLIFKNLFKNIKIPPSGTISLKTDSGIIKMATNQTSYLTQLLFWDGYKSFEYSTLFEDLVTKSSTFLDIGSNIGYYALLAAKSNPKINIYAFEPAYGPKFYLNKNIILNNFSNQIIPIDLALSNSTGKIEFYEVESLKYKYLKHNLAGEGNAGTKTLSRNFVKSTVKTDTLDNFVKTNNIKNIDLIKIDTEGTEIDILESGKESILLNKPIIICETLFDTIEDQLEDFFLKLDYIFFNHHESGLVRVSTIKRTVDNGIRNCFFVPKSKLDMVSKYTQN